MTQPTPLEQKDIALGAKISSHRHDPTVKKAAEVGVIGDQGPLYAMAGTLLLGGLFTCRPRAARAGLTMLLAVGAADAGKTWLKHRFSRSRPTETLNKGEYESGVGGSPSKSEQSFPSGHFACSVAAARALGRQYPASKPWSALAVLVIGLSRMAKGAHWPLDLVAGATVGWLAEGVSSLLLRSVGMRPRDDRSRFWSQESPRRAVEIGRKSLAALRR